MGKVAILSPIVQGQIAAGEVIERPASVVKELVENALDAGARHVEVALRSGGIERIVVRDDGEGMTPEDALLAFARHATSKLTGADDLDAVPTLGFRGEALPSIAAAGTVRLVTRRAADTAAVAVEADASGARAAGPAAAPPGTLVEVRDLFATTPARRKFLRTTPTEVGHVVDLLTRLAVAWPETGFRLEHDGREVIAYPPVRDLRERLAQVLGARARRRDDRLRRGGERPLADGLPRAAARVARRRHASCGRTSASAATGPARGAALGARSAAAARRARRLRVAADARAAIRWPCSSWRRAPASSTSTCTRRSSRCASAGRRRCTS